MSDELLRGTSSFRPRASHLGAARGAHGPAHSTLTLSASEMPLPKAGASGYQRLFEVALEHAYYDKLGDGRCFEFAIQPNVRTSRLMRSLGLLFRNDGASFSVLYDTARVSDLDHFLANNTTVTPSRGPEPWTYLSFFFATKSGQLATVSDIDLTLNPLEWNFYFRNEDFSPVTPGSASAPDQRISKTPLPIRPARFPVTLEEGETAAIRNAPGAAVWTMDPKALRETDLGPPFYADLSQNFEGYYTLEVSKAKRVIRTTGIIYTLAEPAPLCFMHVLLNRPHEGMKGLYPVKLSGAKAAEIVPIRYLIRFEARQTRWVYHVVPRAREGLFSSLRIEASPPPAGEDPIVFEGPTACEEPFGARSSVFTSNRELPLKRRSPYRLRLIGNERGSEERVLVDPLPVAAADQVLRRFPEDDAASREYASHIYVYI